VEEETHEKILEVVQLAVEILEEGHFVETLEEHLEGIQVVVHNRAQILLAHHNLLQMVEVLLVNLKGVEEEGWV